MNFAGRNITHQFRDVRAAVAYALSVRRGPQHRRPSWGASREHGDRDAGHAVVAAIRGDIGIEPDSDDWKAMEWWALADGPEPAWVRKELRPILGQAGLLNDQRKPETFTMDLEDLIFVDDITGEEVHTVREVKDE